MTEDQTRALYERFLKDHPEHQQGVKIQDMGGEMLLTATTETTLAFTEWCERKGLAKAGSTEKCKRMMGAVRRHFNHERN